MTPILTTPVTADQLRDAAGCSSPAVRTPEGDLLVAEHRLALVLDSHAGDVEYLAGRLNAGIPDFTGTSMSVGQLTG